ncbi:MAG: phosphoenolpyruvate carboxykinase (GTP) [Endomicrobiales bacterium]|nr:phosphoenolpyruvate carboxykinase (GTP) [Endomicrobiales bacterium]
MECKSVDLLKEKCSPESYEKLMKLNNVKLHDFVTKYVELCNPDSVYVCNDSDEDKQYIRNKAIENKEEWKLAIDGHTIHFDGPKDQARDKANTKYLIPAGSNLGSLNSIDKTEGANEVHGYLKNIMAGKEMYVLFFCLGPTNSEFSLPCVQITDSSYVGHSEYILYRSGYEQFNNIGDSPDFFRYVHSAGELENGVSKNVDKRRVYVDLGDNIVYSTNTQYAGNTVGLKKLSLRLAINKAAKEGWLAEHMLLMGIHGKNKRKTYFAGAFPSACGKTSTAMLKGETIVGDDIAYLRKKDGVIYGANVECGIFGIIQDVNTQNDPVIWDTLTNPGEAIFSNVLLTEDNIPRWLGDGREVPNKGINYNGEWIKGNEVSYAHKNARYTVSLYNLKNTDPKLDDPNGVEVKGIIYGGRDSSIWPPVQQAYNWAHGVVTMGASLESETTAATLGKEGVRVFNPMSNLDFVAIPIGQYVNSHIKFAQEVSSPPLIFAVNYFQKENNKYLTGMEDKRVWVKWMEQRVNNDVGAIETPTGYVPYLKDLEVLFKEVLNKDYTMQDYLKQFTVKVPENLEKIERITEIYKTKVKDTPEELFKILKEQKERLEAAREKHGEYISPVIFAGNKQA